MIRTMRMMSPRHPLASIVHGLLITAMLVFGYTCARGGLDSAGACSGHEHALASAGCDHDADGHGADRGCDQCAHGAICCSTWGAPPAPMTIDAPPAAAIVPAAHTETLQPPAVFAAGLVPIPAESPPPTASFLRL